MRRRFATVLLALTAYTAAAANARAAEPMSDAASNNIPRSAISAGAAQEATSATHRLLPALGEEIATSTAPTSGTHRLGAGFSQIAHFPGTVIDLAERDDPSVSSATLVWSSPGYDGDLGPLAAGTTYFVRVASYTIPDTFSDHRQANISFSTSAVSPGTLVGAGATGLLSNTTYWARLWTVDAAGNLSYASNISTFVTLALPVSLQTPTFLNVYFTSVTVQWARRPSSPPDASSNTAEGYIVEASSTNFGTLAPGGIVSSSLTYSVGLSTLTVYAPDMIVDRDYYFRVGSLNWNAVPNWTTLGSTTTKFQVNDPVPGNPPYTDLSTGSITVTWDRNGNPAGTQYHAEVSASSDFSGVVTTTDTNTLFFSTGNLSPNTTYYFRVYATTRSVSTSFISLGSTSTWARAPAPAGIPLPLVNISSLTVRWLHNGNPIDVSSYTVIATTEASFPNANEGNVVIVSTRPSGTDPMATLTGLESNTSYYLFAAGINWSNAVGDYILIGTTATRPAPPTAAGFAAVFYSSITASWSTNGNPLGITTYTATLSTVAAYPPGGAWDVSIDTVPDATAIDLSLGGLQLNATYHLFVAAVGRWTSADGTTTSTATLAASPGPSPDTAAYDPVSTGGFTLNWSSGAADPGFNAASPQTTYYAEISASPSFAPVLASSRTFNLSAVFSGLATNTTYYARVSAFSHHTGTWTASVSFDSATLAAAPATAGVTFITVDYTSATVSWGRNGNPIGITTYTVVLSSGTPYPNDLPDNIILDTAPGGSIPSAQLTGLNSGVTYYLSVRALNHYGADTAYVALGSTRTRTSPKSWAGSCGAPNWWSASCWAPPGVPGATDSVTIAQNVSVRVDASSPSISFSSLTLGVPAGNVSANLYLSTAIKSGGSVLIYGNSGLTQANTQQLRILGDWTMISGSSLTHVVHTSATLTSQVWINVSGIFDLQAGATITVSSQGYAGGATNGGSGYGPGPGIGNSASSGGGGGGGHGGAGGQGDGNSGSCPGGTANDSFSDPTDAGSGGGGGDGASGTNIGGAGGGVIRIKAGTLLVNGLIRADGAVGGPGNTGSTAQGAGGGGAGGTVNLQADEFDGTGSISAVGGDGGSDTAASDDPGGGGGGGRVAIDIAVSGGACAISVSTAGGHMGATNSLDGAGGTFSSTSTLLAPTGFTATAISSYSISWTWNPSPHGAHYQVFDQSDSPVSSLLGPSATQFDEIGLLSNTTYTRYVRVSNCGSGTNSLAANADTLTSTPTLASLPFLGVWTTSVTATWTPYPAGGGQGFRLETSSTNFGNLSPGGDVVSSETYANAASALTIFSPALDPNTTYYFRVAGLNWAGAIGPYVTVGSTSTLALPITPISPSYLLVDNGSATVRWGARPTTPPATSSETCEGYLLQASSTNFGALAPGGVILSSLTTTVSLSTLSITGLDPSTTWYFRVATLNHSGASNGVALEPLYLGLTPSILVLSLGGLDGSVPYVVASTSWELTNVGTLPSTIKLWASTATVGGSPWSLGSTPDIETPVIQGLWNSALPDPASFSTPIVASTQASSASTFAGDQNGQAVPVGERRTLWLKFWLPTSTLSHGVPERIEIGAVGKYP